MAAPSRGEKRAPRSEATGLEALSPEAQALGKSKHALNTLISEYDFQRLLEAALIDGGHAISFLVRRAIEEHLNNHPQLERINKIAGMALERDVAMEKVRRGVNE